MRYNSLFLLLLLSLVTLTCAAQQKKQRKMYLMAVGVGEYAAPENLVPDLTNTTSDADSLVSVFSNDSNCEILVLKDAEATGDNVRAKMKSFFGRATEQDNVLFYFSGHGFTGGLCLQDYIVNNAGAFHYDDIKEIFRGLKARGRIVMADACMIGGLRKNNSENQDSVVHRLSDGKQVMLLLSSRGDERSWENSFMKNSFFTSYLKDGLKGAADSNKNGLITAREIYTYVADRLNKLQLPGGVKQHANAYGNFSPGWVIRRLPENK